MFERLTEPARQVVSSAGEESDRLGHNYIGCEHVMAGIARQVDNPAAQILGTHGLDLRAIRAELDRLIDRGILPRPWHNDHELLGSLGVDLDAVLRSMEDAFGVDTVKQAVDRATGGGWTPGHGKVLELKQSCWLAVKQADALRHAGVGPEHLLLGLLIDAQNPLDKPRCFRNAWQRRRRARLGLPHQGPSPVSLIVEQRGLTLKALRKAVTAELHATAM